MRAADCDRMQGTFLSGRPLQCCQQFQFFCMDLSPPPFKAGTPQRVWKWALACKERKLLQCGADLLGGSDKMEVLFFSKKIWEGNKTTQKCIYRGP